MSLNAVALPSLVELSQAELRLAQEVSAQMEEAWANADPFTSACLALQRLYPGCTAGMIGWAGPRGRERPTIMNQVRPSSPFPEPYFSGPGFRNDITYDPRRCDPLALRAVDTDWLNDRLAAKARDRWRERLMAPVGVRGIMRVTVYRGSRLLAVVGYVVPLDTPRFTARDRAFLQAVIPTLDDGLVSLASLRRGSLRSLDLENVASAMPCPLFLVSDRGALLYANPEAQRAFPKYPVWLKAFRNSGNREALPQSVRQVTVRVGNRRVHLVMVAALDFESDAVADSPWALLWDLSPRHARIAALMMRGLADKDIMSQTGLSLQTVRTYVKQVLARAHVHRRAELLHAVMALHDQQRASSLERPRSAFADLHRRHWWL